MGNNGERTLSCVTDGRVVSVSELRERAPGGGFAVIPSEGIFRRLIRRLRREEGVLVCSPADGVVTSVNGCRVTLRTGDGVMLAVELGTGGTVTAQCGEKVLCGERLGFLGSREALVLFAEPAQITELHVAAGRRRRGADAAYYCVR